jgi:hypothetical protein
MSYIESSTLVFEFADGGLYRIVGTAAIQVNGERKFIDIHTTTLAADHTTTIGQDLDALFRLVRWEITDAVIRNRYSEVPREI